MPTNGTVAPSCPISNTQQKVTSRLLPPIVDIASVTPAYDLRSAIIALNQLSSIIQHITRGQPVINNTYVPGRRSTSTPPEREPPPQYPRVTWQQTVRDYDKNELVNPDNDKQRIKIKTIERNIWQEGVTGQRVVYKGRL